LKDLSVSSLLKCLDFLKALRVQKLESWVRGQRGAACSSLMTKVTERA
jgi:hypothetical protein